MQLSGCQVLGGFVDVGARTAGKVFGGESTRRHFGRDWFVEVDANVELANVIRRLAARLLDGVQPKRKWSAARHDDLDGIGRHLCIVGGRQAAVDRGGTFEHSANRGGFQIASTCQFPNGRLFGTLRLLINGWLDAGPIVELTQDA